MKLVSGIAAVAALCLVACGSNKGSLQTKSLTPTPTPKSEPIAAADGAVTANIDYFGATFSPSFELAKQVTGKSQFLLMQKLPLLTYQLSVMIKENYFRGGKFNIYDCADASCSDRKIRYVLQCDRYLSCAPLDANGAPIENAASAVHTIGTYPGIARDGSAYKQGISIEFLDPRILPPGSFAQSVAAEFEPAVGAKTSLVVFQMKDN